ncbi:MAG: hypothetical protein HY905_16980 [Deltaproteobacteria bacterium]|nr:hypothetical protein [Deltaproteobacteria bacterium]
MRGRRKAPDSGQLRLDGKGQLRLDQKDVTGAARSHEPFVPGPNPKLPEFIAEHTTAYDPATDAYDVPAFDRDLVVDKAAPPKAIYDMHTYWSKKHWAAIREYIRHYLPERYYPRGTGLVLDCFSGSGMTGVAAMMEDRPCVLVDASPAAAFISHCYTHPVDPEALRVAWDRMMTEAYPDDLQRRLRKITGEEIVNLEQELDWLYATRCDRCGGPATTEYVVYSERFECPSCFQPVALFDCPEHEVSYPAGKASTATLTKRRRVCPHCLAEAGGKPHRKFAISTRGRKFGPIPVLVRYRCLGGCKPAAAERRHDDDRRTRKGKYFAEDDLGKITRIDGVEVPHWYPQRKMMDVEDDAKPWGMEWRPGRNFRNVADLYTKRNLWALAAWRAAMTRTVPGIGPVYAGLTVPAITCSKMLREEKRAVQTGTYYIPPVARQINLINAADYGRRVLSAGHAALTQEVGTTGPSTVSTDSAVRPSCPPASLDYVFTDPAYMDKVQYGELNFVWEAWLGFDGTWLKDEIVVNPFRGKTADDWDRDMRRVLANLHRALKPSRWMSLCYHDTNPATWTRLQNMILDTGFEIHSVTVLDPKQKSSNQLTGEKVVKSDLVVNCRKPKLGGKGDTNGAGEDTFVSQRVREILIDVLSQAGGQTRDRLWDLVLKRLLTRGQLAEHRFEDILGEVAIRSEAGRWFLKEKFESLSESDLRNEGRAGDTLVRFARLRMAGLPAGAAADVVLRAPHLGDDDVDEATLVDYVRRTVFRDEGEGEKFDLKGRLKGIEFYDCLFFYLTRWLKGRGAGLVPRRDLAQFLDEYLVRFKDGDHWLYRPPDENEAEGLRKARGTGLARRIRQFTAFVRGEGEYPKERRPDTRTLAEWLHHCALFGLAEEGVALFEKGGLAARLRELPEDERYDVDDWYQRCRRRAGTKPAEDAQESDDGDGEQTEEPEADE